MEEITGHSLVLFKGKPACVIRAGEKLEIELPNGKQIKVRKKDVFPIHAGPLQRLADLRIISGDAEIAWEILAGETTTLTELAELIFNEITPSTVWTAWNHVEEDDYFEGSPDAIYVRTTEEVARVRAEREARDADQRAWSDFLQRVKQGEILPAERENLAGVEALAMGRTAHSRVLRDLGRGNTPENAHALLLKLGHWDYSVNPYPHRFELPVHDPTAELPGLPDEDRLDLTHLPAFAIDDEGNEDPDDAISLEGNMLWVHVADVAALVKPKTAADQEAGARVSNLYLPEMTVPMLPREATRLLGLGLNELSPAFSFGMRLNDQGGIDPDSIVITPSKVKVTRLSYAQAEGMLDQEPLKSIRDLVNLYRVARFAHGAVSIDLPEVKVRVHDGQVEVRPLPRLQSREMVTDTMLMAGEAAARFAIKHQIPFPFTTQDPPEVNECPSDLAGMFAFRKHLKRSQTKTMPEPHNGLGLPVYTRATSPLRRYLDLVAHQQLRAWLRDEPLLSPQEITEKVGMTEALIDSLRRTERSSNKHWTLVHLMQRSHWQGRGILVEERNKSGIFSIPELALEASVQLEELPPLNSEITLQVAKVYLPELSVRFVPVQV